MGLLDFLFGTHKRQAETKSKAKIHSYNQGYQDGYRDAYEEESCEDWDCDCMNQNISCLCEEDNHSFFENEDYDQDVYGNGCDSENNEWN